MLEIVHSLACDAYDSALPCTCGLETDLKEIRAELERKSMKIKTLLYWFFAAAIIGAVSSHAYRQVVVGLCVQSEHCYQIEYETSQIRDAISEIRGRQKAILSALADLKGSDIRVQVSETNVEIYVSSRVP